MPLRRRGDQDYASTHFRYSDRSERDRRRYYIVSALTDDGARWLPEPTPPMPVMDARRFVADLERRIAQESVPPPPPAPPMPDTLVTGADLIALRHAVLPGVPPMAARARLAGLIQMNPDHLRHMEVGSKRIFPRTARLLTIAGKALLEKRRYREKLDQRDLSRFEELYTALAESPGTQADEEDHSNGTHPGE